jgi:hypothetical protein
MSTDLARRTSDDICREINACSAKLAQAEKKVEDWKDTRRQFLQELKGKIPDIWLKEAKEKCNIGRAMAYRILQLPKPENVDTSTDASLQSRQEEFAPAAQAEGHAPDLPDDAAPDDRAVQWADEMLLRIEQDIKEEDIDLWLGLHALYRRTGDQIGELGRQRAAALAPPTEPAKKRGRLSGSKNKPKEAEPAPVESPKPAPTGNDVDTEATAERRKADAAAAEAAPAPERDLTIPTFLRRDPPEQPVQP